MNIERRKGTRTKPQPGDVFALRIPDVGWLFGRVIRTTDTDPGFGFGEWPTALIYVYKVIRKSPRPVPALRRRDLLIAPTMTDLKPWRLGYFTTLESKPLKPADAFPRHCFRWGTVYQDEFRERLDHSFAPIGTGGWGSIQTVDHEVSEALGLATSEGESGDL